MACFALVGAEDIVIYVPGQHFIRFSIVDLFLCEGGFTSKKGKKGWKIGWVDFTKLNKALTSTSYEQASPSKTGVRL